MPALFNAWKSASSLSEDDIPADELALLDPAAYSRLMERKAAKQAEIAFFEDRDRQVKAAADKHQREEMAAQEAMLAHAERWDHEKATFGGREITQAEAQEARRYIVDHRDEIVEWGRRHGHFQSNAEGQRFVDNEARLHGLNETERTGTMTPTERAERARLEEQQRPFEAVRAHSVDMLLGSEPEVAPVQSPSPSASSTPGSSNDENPFRGKAPDLIGSFAAQAVPIETPALPARVPVIPTPVASRLSGAGGMS